jgi:thiol-disulfide isomerase/thioredoxin
VLVSADISRVLLEVRRPGASAVLVNVWATWCLPCREEFPDLVRLHREWEDRGLRLVLVSADFEADRAAAIRFLAEQGVDFPSFFKEGSDMEFIDGLDPRWSGALPATFLYDSEGRLRRFWEGKTDHSALASRVEDVVSGRAGGPAELEEKP